MSETNNCDINRYTSDRNRRSRVVRSKEGPALNSKSLSGSSCRLDLLSLQPILPSPLPAAASFLLPQTKTKEKEPGKFGQSGVRSIAGTHRGAPLSPPRRILTLSSISPTSFVLLRGHLIQTNVISPNVLSHGNSIVLVIIARRAQLARRRRTAAPCKWTEHLERIPPFDVGLY